jgi:aryl-alcohol dehydrogenase-like predicted oxidoreductase
MMPSSKLILGTVQLGLDYGINNQHGKPSIEEAVQILEYAYDSGITKLDTAEAYGNAQEIIGLFHKTKKKRFQIITKFSPKTFTKDSNFREHIEQSLRILCAESLEAYMFHSYTDYEQFMTEYDTLDLLKSENILKKIGVSVYTNRQALNLLERDNRIDLIQLPFNLLDNSFHRNEVLEKAQIKGVEIHVRSVFLQGLFMMERSSIQPPLNKLIPYLKLLDTLAQDSRKPMQAIAMNYCLQHPAILGVLFGVDSADQLRQNLRFISDYQLDKNELDIIDNIRVAEAELLNPVNWKLGSKK